MNLKSGVLNCFVCGSFSPERFLVEVEGYLPGEASKEVYEYREALVLIDGEKVVRLPKVDNWAPASASTREFTQAAEEARSRLSPDLDIVKDYQATRGITYETLTKFKVGVLPEDPRIGQLECLVFPYYYGGRVVALRGRTATGLKGGAKGSRMTIYNVDALEGATRCILVEGETDCLRVQQACWACGVDIPVVAAPTAEFKREWAREFEGVDQVIILPQCDDPSMEKFLPQAVKFLGADRCISLILPWRRGQMGKDCADWLWYHTDAELVERLPKMSKTRTKPLKVADAVKIAKQGRDWLLEGLIARGEVGLIVGPPKKKKTFLALSLAHAITTEGTVGPWRAPAKGRVLFIEEEEGEQSWAERVARVFRGDEDTDQFWYYHQARLRLEDPSWLDRVKEDLGDWTPDLIVFDPLVNLHASDENSAQEMIEVWRAVEAYRDAFDAAVFVLVHANKTPNPKDLWGSIRGSSAIGGKADVALFVTRAEGSEVTVKVDGKAIPGGADVVHLTFDSATLRFSPEFLIHVPGRETAADRTLKVIREAGEEGITKKEVAERLDMSMETVRKITETLEGEGKIVVRGTGVKGDPKRYAAIPQDPTP